MQLATYIQSGALRQGAKILTYASVTAGFYFEEAFHLAGLMEYVEVRERWLNTILKASHRYHNLSQLIHASEPVLNCSPHPCGSKKSFSTPAPTRGAVLCLDSTCSA